MNDKSNDKDETVFKNGVFFEREYIDMLDQLPPVDDRRAYGNYTPKTKLEKRYDEYWRTEVTGNCACCHGSFPGTLIMFYYGRFVCEKCQQNNEGLSEFQKNIRARSGMALPIESSTGNDDNISLVPDEEVPKRICI